MSKAMYGIAAVVTLTMAQAWAGDVRTDEKATSDIVASKASTSESQRTGKSESESSRVAKASFDAGKMESKGAPASPEERWLVEREGYRDGGY